MVDKMIESKPSESEDLNDSQRTEKYFDSSFVVLVPKLQRRIRAFLKKRRAERSVSLVEESKMKLSTDPSELGKRNYTKQTTNLSETTLGGGPLIELPRIQITKI